MGPVMRGVIPKEVCFERKPKFCQKSEDIVRNQEAKFWGRHEMMKLKFWED